LNLNLKVAMIKSLKHIFVYLLFILKNKIILYMIKGEIVKVVFLKQSFASN